MGNDLRLKKVVLTISFDLHGERQVIKLERVGFGMNLFFCFYEVVWGSLGLKTGNPKVYGMRPMGLEGRIVPMTAFDGA